MLIAAHLLTCMFLVIPPRYSKYRLGSRTIGRWNIYTRTRLKFTICVASITWITYIGEELQRICSERHNDNYTLAVQSPITILGAQKNSCHVDPLWCRAPWTHDPFPACFSPQDRQSKFVPRKNETNTSPVGQAICPQKEVGIRERVYHRTRSSIRRQGFSLIFRLTRLERTFMSNANIITISRGATL